MSQAKAEAVTWEIRACFNRLRALGDLLHRDLGITTAMRAVLESLHRHGAQTVPQIARAKSVTRQHIQVIVNDLVEARLVTTRHNPDDRRSPLVALSRAGRAAFDRARQREQGLFRELSGGLAGLDLDATIATLRALRALLDHRVKEATDE